MTAEEAPLRLERTLLVGTDDGLHVIGRGERHELAGSPVRALAPDAASWWALVGDGRVVRSEDGGAWREAGELTEQRATCLLPTPSGLFVGTAGAHLFRLAATGFDVVQSFEEVEGRAAWYTPWGGPPATRSLSHDGRKSLYVNVHVGGIPSSDDGGRSWRPTIDIHADAHEVLTPEPAPGLVLAATARGLAVSRDHGESWELHTRGLHATYLRAVAASGETVYVTASEGPRGRHAALYRFALDGDGSFERCRVGLPEWFPENINTACVAAAGEIVAFGTSSGSVFISADHGGSFEPAATGLAPVRAVLIR